MDMIVRAAKQAYADEFISELPDGYDTRLTAGGMNLSGGQRQRIAIARAMLKDSPVILMDEPTSALDPISTSKIEDLAEELKENYTIVMVTHSVKAASTAKRVLFIKDGEVFHQLYRGNLTSDEMYQKITDTLTVLTTGGEHRE